MPGKVSPKEPIAIVGSACHFAGDVGSTSKLWELLKEPRDVRREIPESRFSAQGFHHPDHSHHGRSNVTHSYLLNEDPKAFDAEFFGVNPIEARAMDPQQRMLLETVYEALESGGMTIENLRGSDTSVFAGVMCGDYEAMLLRDLDEIPTYFAVGTSPAVLSNRISYFFDWHGASVTTDTACSSSLVAVHSAVQTLRSGDSRMAVACGSNVILGPEMYIIESKLKMLSPDGLGRMWDKDANGYARGDGVAAVILKTLSAALEDNDHIECIIRETGLNQDGATAGLTMPSATAQKALIQATYAKAGLDIGSVADRPQYFEAHGTGTPAGDPVEAKAISTAFFKHDQLKSRAETSNNPLYVGSIKTVLGHTEGTAGVAAILKASLALQNSCIPPNLLFNNINPSIVPFYRDLKILKDARPWPAVPPGQPRRASVNSFGFGGANAHAILENYESSADACQVEVSADTLFTPFVFSAASADSLRGNLTAYAKYLDAHTDVNIGDLAYTLRERRSTLPQRVSLPATNSSSELATAIRVMLEDEKKKIGIRTLPGKSAGTPRLLGVFTGQGAQYVRQGAELIEQSPFARRIIQALEVDLASLPAEDRPTWSLEAEILAGSSTPSRINEAVISQPLCTAIQILMVELLRAADVHFDAVVGHSSGEIAAAYTAGFLTARDAIYIAYYRGLHCKHAASPNGEMKGAMLAVGTSIEDALQLCEDEEFAGRIGLAASNSSSSVTISGDEDAIEELEFILEDEKKFHRRLRVDMAYHSHHMEPCSGGYIDSLQRAGVKARPPPSSSSSPCTWYSSVYDGKPIELSTELNDVYWAQNMTRPVLFTLALKSALVANPVSALGAVLELGPHPALKGPASQTIQETIQDGIPYHGTLSRGINAIAAFSTCLGFLWERMGGLSSSIDMGRCQRILSTSGKIARFNLLKGLPTYQWKHDVHYWHESRRSRRIRSRSEPYHPLLGDKSPDSAAHVLRWKNILRPSKVQWLEGHQVQGQIVFPASAYISTAVEAATSLARGRTIRLIELSNFTIHQGLGFESREAGIEVQIELSRVSQLKSECFTSYFTYSAAMGGNEESELTLIADGELKVHLGDASLSLLPPRQPTAPHLLTVDPVRLYNFMESLEYNFSGPFLSLVELRRKLGIASCVAKRAKASSQPDADLLLIHPVELDAAIQSVSLAYSYPGDEQLRLLHMPTTIAKIRINPAVLALQQKQRTADDDNTVGIDSSCNRDRRAKPGSGFSGNFNIYVKGCPNAAIQVDKVKFQPVRSSASDDRNVFYKMQYVPCEPDGTLAAASIPVTKSDTDLLWAFSRIVCYYLREFDRVPEDSLARSDSTLEHYLNYARHMTTLLKNGGHRYGKVEWLNDNLEDIMAEVESKGLAENPVVKIMLLVGNTMPKVFRGETTMLEHFRTSGLLDEYYAKGFGTAQSTMWLSNVVKQITDRRPHLNLLEIGAGTGGATKQILRTINRDFDSYTFTDISSSFFENAAGNLSEWRDRMVFKVCDAEQDPLDQGFVEGRYDVVIAFLVVHATARLDETMRNLRKLLKPGGFLLIGEGNSEGPMQAGASYIFGPLPGWWRGVDEGRTLTPFINVEEWDAILKRTGFSGIDTISPQQLLDTFGTILFVSQATDQRIESIRAPLKSPVNPFSMKKLVIVGGKTPEVATVAEQLASILRPSFSQTNICVTLEDLEHVVLEEHVYVIGLIELEQPVFKGITHERWSGFRELFIGEKTVLWLTSGRLEDEPYANMTVGFGRSAIHEEEDLVLQLLDIPNRKLVDAHKIAETFICLAAKHPSGPDLLYTLEPEVVTDAEGHQLVPRLCPIQGANDRLNCIQRPIVHQVDAENSKLELQSDHDGYSLRQLSRFEVSNLTKQSTSIELRTTKSMLSAIRTPAGQMFLAVGVDPTGLRYLTLTSSLTSVIKTPEELAIPIVAPRLADNDILILTAAQLLGIAIVEPLLPGQKMILHDAPKVLSQAIESQALSKGIHVVCTTDETDGESIPSSWIQLSPNMSSADLDLMIPTDVASLISFSKEVSENEETISSLVPPYCRKDNTRTLFSRTRVDYSHKSLSILSRSLETAIGYAQSQSYERVAESISLETIIRGECPADPLTVLDWTSSSAHLPARVTRFDTRPLFRGDRTYWICGLSGALGISLCDWMIGRGVRHLVLTSRNPRIDPVWIEDHKRNGANVEIFSCDVTDEEALRAVHDRIVASLPPVAGVLNGAMVLRDVSVRNMSFDQVTDVVGPKVLGSIHLDRIFHDTELDFFILLSSINCIIGNVGQANYAAANMGMCGLAAHRRKRGLAATVINVGAVIGAGYITESDRQLDAVVAKMAMIHLSEDDFHQIFAEAINAGHVDSPDGPEISTGLLDISADASNIPKWYSDPKFSRFIVHKSSSSGDQKRHTKAVSIQDRLSACQSEKDILHVAKEGLAAQLRTILQLSTADDDLMSMRSVDLGLDSLVSVDIRSWFLKNFEVSIPVLKIMANDVSMMTLAELAAEGVPAELTPQVGRQGQSQSSDDTSSTGDDIPRTPGSESTSKDFSSDTDMTTPITPTETKDLSVAASIRNAIDWDAEVRLPEPDRFGKMNTGKSPSAQPRIVLLTGSSGLLGHHLLKRLSSEPSIVKIICVAVRRLSERLGLAAEEASEIFTEVDAVIHNGSDTSHLKYYSAVRECNVESTPGMQTFPEVSTTASGIRPPADGAHGYMCSKWVCEYLLEGVSAAHGLRISINRPSTIVREGEDATTAEAEFDWVNALLHYSHRIRAVPRAEHNQGAFDLVYIRTVCNDIMKELFRIDHGNTLTYTNNVGDVVIPMRRMAEIGKTVGNEELYRTLRFDQWADEAIKAGLQPAVAALIETFDEPKTAWPALVRGKGS
ncbi:lovastatin nonaketide synthase [Diaporthe amygdali]|uniref:lovastatin nonaketide synthase n=1 Tax=Phomopsis amygdali TaxID=1214568 RepID=UPI0022FE3471|nr:lovastatin nonaketide synthase [Diaporthe amygdali]KAJ0117744.1 lovastatin nonaketide synthase [Diaporthe amygdali]